MRSRLHEPAIYDYRKFQSSSEFPKVIAPKFTRHPWNPSNFVFYGNVGFLNQLATLYLKLKEILIADDRYDGAGESGWPTRRIRKKGGILDSKNEWTRRCYFYVIHHNHKRFSFHQRKIWSIPSEVFLLCQYRIIRQISINFTQIIDPTCIKKQRKSSERDMQNRPFLVMEFNTGVSHQKLVSLVGEIVNFTL